MSSAQELDVGKCLPSWIVWNRIVSSLQKVLLASTTLDAEISLEDVKSLRNNNTGTHMHKGVS